MPAACQSARLLQSCWQLLPSARRNPTPMPLRVHSSNRLETLARMLTALNGSSADPFEPLRIVVQTPGVARWLSLRLADLDGCCMNVRYVFPANFMQETLSAALGKETLAGMDAQADMWHIFAKLDSAAVLPGGAELERYLESGSSFRRLQLSRRIAELFGRYALYRPELLDTWEAGGGAGDWQAELWRSLRSDSSALLPAELLRRFSVLQAPQGLPERALVFGVSTLPPLQVQFLSILARHRHVELFLLSPCAQYWGDLPGRGEAKKARAAGQGDEFGQPLLSSLGAQGADLVNLLSDVGSEPGMEVFEEPGEDSVLARMQGDLLNMLPSHERLETQRDSSLVLASCAGATRELEALKDHLLQQMDEDRSLRPRDILVLAPDIGKFAPGIKAVFGTSAPGEQALPFHVADRGPREQPLCDALLRLCELVRSRRTATELLSLLEQPALAERFDLDAEELARLRGICLKSGVRWGLDAADREALGLGPEEANTWQAGFDSMVLGAMMNGREDVAFADIAPWGEAEGGNLQLLARATSAFMAIRRSVRSLEGERTPAEWAGPLREAVASLLPTADEHAQELSEILSAISRLESQAPAASQKLDIRCIHSLMEEELLGAMAPHGFLSGGITFAELKPMRSVPARLICLIGMDDEAFPRQDRPLSFDLIARAPRMGDASRRAGDRYLFLETLLCARERLYISYSGVSPQGGPDSQPSVPVSELMEYLAGPQYAEVFLVRHPLQPFSRSYFLPGATLFSYSRSDYEAALAATRREPREAFCSEALEMFPEGFDNPDLDTLCEFLAHPDRFFLEQVMGMRNPREERLPEDEEPLELDGLGYYEQMRRLTNALSEGRDPIRVAARSRAEGVLPWGLEGEDAMNKLRKAASDCHAKVVSLLEGPRESLHGTYESSSQNLPIRLNVRMSPIVNGRLVEWRPGRLRTTEYLRAWVYAIAAGALRQRGIAACPQRIVQIGTDSIISMTIPDDACERMERLLGIYRSGIVRPLPLFLECGFAAGAQKAGGRASVKSPYEKALDVWDPSYTLFRTPERDDVWTRAAFRDVDPVRTYADEFMELADALWRGYHEHLEELK